MRDCTPCWKETAFGGEESSSWTTSGMSKMASAYQMGHNPVTKGSMRDHYDNPEVDEALDEQSALLPNGVLGYLDPPKVEVVQAVDPVLAAILVEYMAGKLTTMELANRMETLRLKQHEKAISSALTP